MHLYQCICISHMTKTITFINHTMSKKIVQCIDELIGFDGVYRGWATTQVNLDPSQVGPSEVLKETEDISLVRRGDGTVDQIFKSGDYHRHTIEWPIQSRKDWDAYKEALAERLGTGSKLMRMLMSRAKSDPKTIIIAEADHLDVLKAAQIIHDDGIGKPILLGDKKIIKELMKEINFVADLQILDPKCNAEEERRNRYAKVYWEKRQRNGITLFSAQKLMRERNYFAAMMLNDGDGDSLITGYSRSYPSVVKPMIELIGKEKGVKRIAATNIMLTKRGPIFFSDTAINIEPTAEELANIAYMTSVSMRMFGFEPNLAMLSFSNFGSSSSPLADKVSQAVEILHRRHPEVNVDGEIQADFALNPKLMKDKFPFSRLTDKKVNGLIFPSLESANIGYKLMKEFDQIVSIGPIIMGLQKPVHIIQLGAGVDEIVNIACVAIVHAQEKMKSM